MDMSKPAIIVPGQGRQAGEPRRRISVAIVVPSGDHVHANFAMALAFMTHVTAPTQVHLPLVNVKGSNVARQRNNAVDKALELGCDYVLMIDSDMTFPPNALARLLAHQKDVVGGTYARRSLPHNNLAKPIGDAPVTVNGGLLEVAGMPAGFFLFRASVLEKITRPYFRFPTNEVSGEVEGEDYDFCARLRAAGVSVWLDVDLSHELIHWGEHGIRLTTGQDESDEASVGYELIELPGG